MRRLLSLTLLAACGGDHGLECPPGWEDAARGTCDATEAYLAEVRDAIGAGAYGFAWQSTGACEPLGLGCTESLVADLEIRAFPADDLTSAASGTTTTDAHGRYALALPEGVYALTATDPVDGLDHRAGTASVTTDAPLSRVILGFSHAAL